MVMEGSGKMLWLGMSVLMDFFLMLESVCIFLAPRVQSHRAWDFHVFISIPTQDVETIIFRE